MALVAMFGLTERHALNELLELTVLTAVVVFSGLVGETESMVMLRTD